MEKKIAPVGTWKQSPHEAEMRTEWKRNSCQDGKGWMRKIHGWNSKSRPLMKQKRRTEWKKLGAQNERGEASTTEKERRTGLRRLLG
jgi:hypothetical protein